MWQTYVWVDDADAAAEQVAAAGGSVLAEPIDLGSAGRTAVVADPAGAPFALWQPGASRGARVVNEPGAWAMSMLASTDPREAERFYGEIFGWETDDFDGMWLWRLRGFVGGEPMQPVPRDVIGVMMPPRATGRRAGTSTSGSATPTNAPPGPRSSAAASSWRRSTPRSRVTLCSRTRRARSSRSARRPVSEPRHRHTRGGDRRRRAPAGRGRLRGGTQTGDRALRGHRAACAGPLHQRGRRRRGLALARSEGFPVAIRSGGHCFAGRSSTDGVVIDVSPMNSVSLDGEVASLGAGARLGDVYDALAAQGRTIAAGCGPEVGIAGLALGGGLGILGRSHGLTADQLLGASLVLADGRIVEAGEQREPDLFWALGAPAAANSAP